ncbi:MAG: TIM barrel protein [Anaerolineae bacterium]
MLFAVQTTIVPGDTLHEKFDQLVRWGYDGVEVSGADLLERPDDVRRASEATGLRVTSVCGGYQGWLVERNPRARALAIGQIQRILAVGAEMGIAGLVVPAAYGIGARAGLPPARYAFTVDEDRALLLDSLEQALASAQRSGGVLYLEPLNRYEDASSTRWRRRAPS